MLEEKHVLVWNSCLSIIRDIVEPQPFATWFERIVPVKLEDATLTLRVPTEFFREYLEAHYLDLLKKVLHRELGPQAKLIYEVKIVSNQPVIRYPGQNTGEFSNKEVTMQASVPATANPFVIPGLQKLKINPQLNPAYCFDNLIEGECNRLGLTAGRTIAANPGKTAFNPIFIYGASGMGKTHLAQAIGIAIKEAYPELVVLYVPANRFKIQYMDAVNVRNKLADFLHFYMKIDVLIVDDIQEFADKQGTQNAFFQIFNHLHQNGKQLVFTSDRAPVDLQKFEERLLSRLKWGLSTELMAPDFDTRLSMLRQRSFREGVDVPDEVLSFLASKITTNFRELEGALISLIANSTLAKKEITIDLASEVVGNIVGKGCNEITVERVRDVVCKYFNIDVESMDASSRKREIAQARQIAMYLSRNHTKSSLSAIGEKIGGRHYATVLHACKSVTDLIDTDTNVRQYVADIEKTLLYGNGR